MIAATATYQEKRDWVLRPVGWAFRICLYSLIFGPLLWYDGHVEIGAILAFAMFAFMLVGGLLGWALYRINQATQTRAQ